MTDHDATRPVGAISRRRLLQGSALAGFGAFVAACRPAGGASPTPSAAASEPPSAAASEAPSASAGPLGGKLNFANWTAYIDLTVVAGADGDEYKLPSPTLDQFKEVTGIEVNYQESVNDNEEFFGTDLQTPLSQGKSTGWDIVILTDFMAARLIRLGWVETIDTTGMKNYPANLEDAYLTRSFDPGAKMAAPWQSGTTGLGFDSAKTGQLDSIEAFWDTKYKGKVDYLSEMRDTVGLAAIRLGFDPGAITDEQFDQALAEVKKAIDSKLVRTIKGNDYLADLASGDVVLAMSWSGDILQLQLDKDTVQYAVPKEGGMLWTDNMLIPKGAENKKQAEAFIDFYYDPAMAAQVEDFVNYVCPVKGAKEALLAINPDNANNPLIFPPADVLARVHVFKGLDEATEKKYLEAWNAVIGL